ncbi:KAP family P-loop NTPase fold protein [Parvimonas micra]
MEKEKKYFKELKKKVDIYFVIIISMLSSLSIYMLYERKILNQENIYVLMAILTISFIVYIFSIIKNFKSKNINELDKAIFFSNIFLITSLFMIIVIKSIKNRDLLLIYNLTKRLMQRNISISFTVIITSVIIVLTVLSLISLRIRNYFFKSAININKRMSEATERETLKETNHKITFTLKDIIDWKPNNNLKNIDKIIIKDSDDDIPDIFKIDRTKEELKIAINKYSTIGVVGEWGSGKSTLINSTIKELGKNDFIIIKDFDPWSIKSQDALILAMYNTIIENLGENIGFFKRKKIQNALINISTNIPYIGKGIANFFENSIDDYTEYKEIKDDLEEKLEKSDKRLIFIIDNLDRMKSDNVLFLLTLIGTLFKLPNINYIIAYDRNRLNTIFKDEKVNSKYLEKVINKEIFMPVLDRDILKTCLKNLLIIYNYDIFNYDDIIKKICKKFDNIRQFICFCNSLTKKPYIFNNLRPELDYPLDVEYEFFIIQSIKFFDYQVYLKIYTDKNLFIENIEQGNITEFIDDNYEEYSDLMKLLFSKRKNKYYSILNATFFKMCFLDIDKNMQKTIDCIFKLESNYNYYRNIEFEYGDFKNIKEEINVQKETFIDNLLPSYPTKYDIIYAFSQIEFLINFKKITFIQKEILWNFFIKCTSNNINNLYTFIILEEPRLELKDSIDNSIKSILQCIFLNLNTNEIKLLAKHQIQYFNKNQEEYCKTLLIIEWAFKYIKPQELNNFMKNLYIPIVNEPVFLWDKDLNEQSNNHNYSIYNSSHFYTCLSEKFDSSQLYKYTYGLYKKLESDGKNLYKYIDFFINKKRIIQNFANSRKFPGVKPMPEDVYFLMEKYPPVNETEEEIKKSFEKTYPKIQKTYPLTIIKKE